MDFQVVEVVPDNQMLSSDVHHDHHDLCLVPLDERSAVQVENLGSLPHNPMRNLPYYYVTPDSHKIEGNHPLRGQIVYNQWHSWLTRGCSPPWGGVEYLHPSQETDSNERIQPLTCQQTLGTTFEHPLILGYMTWEEKFLSNYRNPLVIL
jgi:hypothetical protein